MTSPHVEIQYATAQRRCTEEMTACSSWATSLTKQNRIYQFFRKRFNQRRLQFLFAYSFSSWLTVMCFVWPFEKLLLNVRLCSIDGILMTSDMT